MEVENSKSDVSKTENNLEIKDNNKLVISSRENKVFLPYKREEIENIFNESGNYNTLNEVIEDKFVVPMKRYRYPMFARYKEAVDLIRNREKGSVIEAFSLGWELSQVSELNPAIITACKTLDELDIYLSYMETNELDKFDIFKVIFEVPLDKVKHS